MNTKATSKPAKTTTKHPYEATEHRVIDSPAYADLSYSARAVLTLLTRQITVSVIWTTGNNGHLQATASFMQKYGISENTLGRALKELISHGFIARTCADRINPGGNDFKRIAAKFAVTWLPIKNRTGLFLDSFKACAWRDWTPETKKIPPPKLAASYPQNGDQPTPSTPKLAARPTPKIKDNELVPITGSLSPCSAVGIPEPAPAQPDDQPDGYQRIHDGDLTAGYWDAERGEMIPTPSPRPRMAGAAIDLTRSQLAGLQRRSA